MNSEQERLLRNEWREQAVEETVKRIKEHIQDERRLSDYATGFRDGWRQCISVMKLHGVIR